MFSLVTRKFLAMRNIALYSVLAKYYKEETPIKTVGKNHPISDRTMSFLIYAIPSKKPLFPKTNIFKGMQHIHRIGTAVSSLQIIKVSKFQKQIFLFSFEPKNETKLFFISAVAPENGSNQKN